MTGRIENLTQGVGVPVAIAVNSRIVATTRTYARENQIRFAALVPEEVWRPGANSVEVYLIESSPAASRLSRLGGTASALAVPSE